MRTRGEKLAHVAFLYYVQGLSQADVAQIMGVTRSNVSRMLTAAREQYIVRFEIDYPRTRILELEQRLLASFEGTGVREVVVTPAKETGDIRFSQGLLSVGQACCGWIESNMTDGQTLGLCWGSTIESMVESAHFNRRVNVDVVQIAGELSIDSRFSGHDLVRNLAHKLGGTYQYFNAPAAAVDEPTANALARSPQVARALDSARASDVVIVGIGKSGDGSSNLFLDRVGASAAEIKEVKDSGAVGQLSGRFFDNKGRELDLEINRRLLSLDLQELRNIHSVIAVASGERKRAAVRAAIRGGLVDVLVIDESLATGLLQEE